MSQSRLAKEIGLTIVAICSGMVVWVGIVWISGRVEAWDSPLYLVVGLPVLGVVCGLLGYLSPKRPWRWAVLPAVGQYGSMVVLGDGVGNLWPLSIVAVVVLSMPLFVAVLLGVGTRRCFMTRQEN